MTSPVLFSSSRDDWCTPPAVLDRIRTLGPIGLDPCGCKASVVAARIEIMPEQDGLSVDWAKLAAGELVYMNPPYGRDIGRWTEKASVEAKRGAEIIALIHARTDTKWFQRDARTADALLFWAGRLTFLGAPSSAPFPSVLLYWGRRPKEFLSLFEGRGFGLCP